MLLLAAIPLTMQLVAMAVSQPPDLDVHASCRAVEPRSAPGTSREVCQRSEREASSRLTREWKDFRPADRRYCMGLSTLGGLPSYVELLTCLELARDARALHNKAAWSTTAKPSPSTTGWQLWDIQHARRNAEGL